MKGLETLIRVRKWELDEKRKTVVELQKQQDRVIHSQKELEDEILRERQKASENIEFGRTFAGYYQQAMDRRTALQAEFDSFALRIDAARDEMAEAFGKAKQFEELKESLDEKDAAEQAAKETESLNEIGLNLYIRKPKMPDSD